MVLVYLVSLSRPLALPRPLQLPHNLSNIDATYFLQNGVAGACGTVHKDTDLVVAPQTAQYVNGDQCGRTITITDNTTVKTTTGVVADECPTCNGSGSIDLSESLFKVFAPTSQGVFPVSWHFNAQ
ncbi:hypothetical protein M422DRAFT_255591 [Sphaerobolus stellatus SS14]|uniref:RlpA-like protein double-psi beta-barrel domain-containing protein n=1 Tax=Sphaerobolus stellatus (strain SS14) TaxID=990650 RepID=A0A0C9V381_SPHS4|nr:hypothetical protein M422DRAFT_255591 [Sphaerobolus stellatus SS14]